MSANSMLNCLAKCTPTLAQIWFMSCFSFLYIHLTAFNRILERTTAAVSALSAHIGCLDSWNAVTSLSQHMQHVTIKHSKIGLHALPAVHTMSVKHIKNQVPCALHTQERQALAGMMDHNIVVMVVPAGKACKGNTSIWKACKPYIHVNKHINAALVTFCSTVPIYCGLAAQLYSMCQSWQGLQQSIISCICNTHRQTAVQRLLFLCTTPCPVV